MIWFCVRMQIKECTKCPRLSQQLDRAITTVFKPVANHDFNVISREEENGSIVYPVSRQLLRMVLLFCLISRLFMRRKRSRRGRW